jgi:hypothetical protein
MADTIIFKKTAGGVIFKKNNDRLSFVKKSPVFTESGNKVYFNIDRIPYNISLADTYTINDVAYTTTTTAALTDKLRDEVFN